MKCRLFALLISAGLALAQTKPAPSDAARENQQKARTAVEQMIHALGGEAYLTLRDSQSEGRVANFANGTSQSSTVFVRFWRWPDKERTEYTRQRDVVILIDGDSAWELSFRGARPLHPAKDPSVRLRIERRRYSLETVVREWLKDPGTALFDEGPALTENHDTERITVMNSANETVTLSIDRETHLPVKKTFILRDPATHQRDEIAEVYDNWKTVQGIATAYNTLILCNGELLRQEFLSSISYNKELPEALFTREAGIHKP